MHVTASILPGEVPGATNGSDTTATKSRDDTVVVLVASALGKSDPPLLSKTDTGGPQAPTWASNNGLPHASLIGRWPLDVIDDEDWNRRFCGFEPQAKLL